MNRKIYILFAVVIIAGLTACKAESYSTSKTEANFSVTKDGETTEKNVSAQTSAGLSTDDGVEAAVEIETDGGDYDSAAYDLNYFVNDDGNLVIYVPETENDWWREISINESEETMDYLADEIDEDGIYYVEIAPTIQDGDGQAIVGHFTADSEKEAVDFAVVDVTIEDGKVVEVTDSGFISDLSEL